MSTIHTRLAEKKDIPAIHDLVRELAVYEKAEEEFTASLEDYYRDFEEGVFDVLVAEMDQTVCGMALYYMTYSTWKGKMLYLEDFVVKQTHRRHGIGQVLFDGFLQLAKQKECRIVKWQVLDWNTPALRFYEKNKAIIERDWWNGKIFL
ncbi:MAG: N-acetyltransferase [Saprospiraceae bacterium]|nr:MAG: N-acetyltransferase [Saprospiraceae bacterium]